MVSMPPQKINKLCTHVHHRDRSAAATIFANGTYFVDTPCILQVLKKISEENILT
jgi:ethanolamine utilization cobalamin adenosyltransferase